MKKFIPTLGGHELKNDDLRLIQDAYLSGFKALAALFHSSTNVILQGVVITDTGTDISCTSGYASWQGEFYEVPATTFPKNISLQLFLKLNQSVLPPSPTQYQDGSSHNVHFDRIMELTYFQSGFQGEYLSNFYRADSGGVKPGTIIDWYGNVSLNFNTSGLGINAMTGYAICNGNTFGTVTTPDLRGRFRVMATNVPSVGAPGLSGALGTYNLTDTGGEKEHLLNSAEQGGIQTRNMTDDIGGGGTSAIAKLEINGVEANRNGASNQSGWSSITNHPALDASAPHENRPPYYALITLIKL